MAKQNVRKTPRGPTRERYIEVEGFKSMRSATRVKVRPLTILCGANSSGKSAFMQPMLLVKQTAESVFDPGPLLLQGPHVSFDNAQEMFWHGKSAADQARRFRVAFIDFDGETVELTFKKVKSGLDLHEMTHVAPRLRADGGQTRVDRELRTVTVRPDMEDAELRSQIGDEVLDLFVPSGSRERPIRISRSRSFLEVEVEVIDDLHVALPRPSGQLLQSAARSMIHLPGLRDSPSRLYPVTKHDSSFPGPFQVYTASVVSSWAEAKDDRLEQLNQQLRSLGLTWKVSAARKDDTKVSMRVGRLPHAQHGGAHDLVSLADVGLGVSQTLPVLVGLLAARQGQLVYLEQPELHLHPRAQVAMGDVLMDAARRGVLVICETHSHLIIRAVQTAVARTPSLSSLVSLNWFARDTEGATVVNSAELDSTGSFGEWPVDFADIEIAADREYLDASLPGWS